MKNFDKIERHEENAPCPVHGKPFRKLYTYGSTLSGETDVCTFHGCGCAVSIVHDPVGTYPASIMYHNNFSTAAGRGRMWAMECAVKYR